MTDISVIILVGKEELHIQRCLEKLAPLEPRQVFIVESQHGDRTHEVAIETALSLGWQTIELKEDVHPQLSTLHSTLFTIFHDWPGLYAKQFNWALEYVEGISKSEKGESADGWILRLDADEYLTPDTIDNLKQFLAFDANSNHDTHPNTDTNSRKADRAVASGAGVVGTSLFAKSCVSRSDLRSIAGLTLELKRRFCGGEIRHATNGIRLLRIWRAGHGKSEERAMDEHIAIDGISDLDELRNLGKVKDFPGAFYDDNLNGMDWWREKHHGYAKREAADALAFYRGELHFKSVKEKYYRLPPYFRAFAYFTIRYFLKGGILDGYAGWMWNFWQGLWYRLLVDREIGKLQRECIRV